MTPCADDAPLSRGPRGTSRASQPRSTDFRLLRATSRARWLRCRCSIPSATPRGGVADVWSGAGE